jgi:protein required for attachment to host cells
MNNKLIIVTDLGQLKVFRLDSTPKHTPRLQLLETMTLEETHHRLRDMVADAAGRHTAPTNRGWGAPVTDDHNLRLETKHRLVRAIAQHIQTILSRAPHNSWWLAASKEIAHEILDELPHSLRDQLEKLLPCDLTKASTQEIVDHFLDKTVSST